MPRTVQSAIVDYLKLYRMLDEGQEIVLEDYARAFNIRVKTALARIDVLSQVFPIVEERRGMPGHEKTVYVHARYARNPKDKIGPGDPRYNFTLRIWESNDKPETIMIGERLYRMIIETVDKSAMSFFVEAEQNALCATRDKLK